MSRSNHPVIALLEMLERRRGRPWWWVQLWCAGPFLVMLLVFLPSRMPLAETVTSSLIFGCAGGFCLAATDCLRFLSQRLRGCVSDDVRSCLLDPAELLDGTTRYCMGRTARDSAFWWLLLTGWVLWNYGLSGLLSLGMLFVLLGIAAWAELQFAFVPSSGRDSVAARITALPALLLMVAACGGMALAGVGALSRQPAHYAGGLLVLLLSGLALRWLAVSNLLTRFQGLLAVQRPVQEWTRQTRPRLVSRPDANPIVVREWHRLNWFPWGASCRLAVVVVLLVATEIFLAIKLSSPEAVPFRDRLQLILLLLIVQAGGSTWATALNDLRDDSRLVALKQTALTAREYVNGITRAILVPSFIVLLTACPLIWAYGGSLPAPWLLAAAMANLCLSLLFVYGIMVADRLIDLRSTRGAWGWSHRFLVLAGGIGLVVPVYAVMFVPSLIVPISIFFAALTVVMYGAALRAMGRHFPR